MAELVWGRQPANYCEPQLRRAALLSADASHVRQTCFARALLIVQKYPPIAPGSNEMADLELGAHSAMPVGSSASTARVQASTAHLEWSAQADDVATPALC